MSDSSLVNSGKRSKVRLVAASCVVWFVIALIWGFVQFAVSEFAYQVSYNLDEAGEYDIASYGYTFSDTIAWPAQHLYSYAQAEVYKEVLQQILDEPEHNDELKKKAKEFLARVNEGNLDDEAENGVYDFIESIEGFTYDTTVESTIEYAIYGGSCLAWGFGISLFGLVCTVIFIYRPTAA